MIAGKGSEISSKVLSDMKEFLLSTVISSEAVTFVNKIISLPAPSLSDKGIKASGDETLASKLTPVENSSTVIMDALDSTQEDSITVIPETPNGSQQQQQEQDPLQEDNTQISVEAASQTTVVGCLATMTMETLDIPSHIDKQMLHHTACVLVNLLFRFPVFFKPLYRLAWLFYKLKAFQVTCSHPLLHAYTYIIQLAKMCLLGPLPTEFQQGKILPLFVLKSNVFTVSNSRNITVVQLYVH